MIDTTNELPENAATPQDAAPEAGFPTMNGNGNHSAPVENQITEEVIVLQENVESQADDDAEHLDDLNLHASFSNLSKEELVAKFEDALKDEDIDANRNQVKLIMETYEARLHDEKETKANAFIVAGNDPAEFKYEADETDRKFERFVKKYNKIRTEHRRKKEQLLQDNLEEKRKIIDELKNLSINESNLRASFDKLHELQTKWRSVGFVPKSYSEDLWTNYRFHIDRFYDLLKINKDLRELDQKKNLELKKELCEKAEDLLAETSINKSTSQLRILQEKWRSAGHVPKEQSDLIWQRFRAVSEKLNERRGEHVAILEKQQNENLSSKLALCEKMEKFVTTLPKSHKKWHDLFSEVDGVMNEWKKTGFASKKENEVIWDRFRKLRKTFFENRDAFYENQRKEYAHNYKLKTDLCMQAEAMLQSTEWKQGAEQYKKLQEQWKTVGAVAPKFSDKLWNRFRTACNQFFENRKGHFAGQQNEMAENLRKKTEFIKMLEEHQMVEDGTVNIDSIKKFQNEWMSMGMVPYEEKDKINKSYHTALDKLMNKVMAKNPQNKDAFMKMSFEHKAKSAAGQDELRMDRGKIHDKITKLQKEAALLENNISFFGKSKNAEKMKEEFMGQVNDIKAKIKTLKDQLKVITEVAS